MTKTAHPIANFHRRTTNDEAATTLALSVASRGNIRSETLRAFPLNEFKGILAKLV